MDLKELVAVRMWKGYRDAQAAWSVRREGGGLVRFLVLYAPRRGLLEAWKLPFGGRCLAVQVGPGCRLVQSTPLLGCGGDLWRSASCAAHLLHESGNILLIHPPHAASKSTPRGAGGIEADPNPLDEEGDILEALRSTTTQAAALRLLRQVPGKVPMRGPALETLVTSVETSLNNVAEHASATGVPHPDRLKRHAWAMRRD